MLFYFEFDLGGVGVVGLCLVGCLTLMLVFIVISGFDFEFSCLLFVLFMLFASNLLAVFDLLVYLV